MSLRHVLLVTVWTVLLLGTVARGAWPLLSTKAPGADPTSLASALVAMQAAEQAALASVPVTPTRAGAAEQMQSDIGREVAEGGARVVSLTVLENAATVGGLLRRRIALRVDAPSTSIGRTLQAIRGAAPTLTVTRVSIEAPASQQTPNPSIVLEGVLWVTPNTAPAS
jgi:hypothetical protein